MTQKSRTKSSLLNSAVSILHYFVSLCLSFISRKVFLDYLGAEILGLNSTIVNLLQFLNITELGVGTAVTFSLYKPLADRDENCINEILALHGKLYRRIAILIIAGAAVMAAFFPLIFEKMQLPLWYAYASFGVLLFSSLLSYFVNYRQAILNANQESYKITYSYYGCLTIKSIVQIIAVSTLSMPFMWWLILEFVFTIIASVTLNITIRKSHPYLKKINQNYQSLKNKYRIIQTKIKQLFFHRLAEFAVLQSSPLIIYAYLSLTTVTYYTNYITVITGITLLFSALFGGFRASVGNLIAEGDQRKTLLTFEQLYCTCFLVSAVCSLCTIMLITPFVSIWIGSEYILPRITIMLITISLFLNLHRIIIDIFINGYGLFKDIWAPVAEAIITLGGAIILGSFYGLNGIIGGPIISQVLILTIWKPYLLYRSGLNTNATSFFILFSKCLAATIPGIIICHFLTPLVNDIDSISTFLISAFIIFTSVTLSISATMAITSESFRKAILRIRHLFAS